MTLTILLALAVFAVAIAPFVPKASTLAHVLAAALALTVIVIVLVNGPVR